MRESLGGCTRYRKGRLDIEVGLPEREQVCRWCRFVKWESGIGRAYCAVTHEYLVNPVGIIGDGCPIEWEEKANEHI